MISIIIPTLNEAGSLPAVLAVLEKEQTPHEVIVVDGGSADGTRTLAKASGVRWFGTSPGRGQQLATGADQARGEVLVFLHADSVFPAGGLEAIDRSLRADRRCPGGNFRLLFDGGTPFSAWLTGFYARIRKHGFYYGDSGIFVRREVYQALGGIKPIALMEDFDFVRRLEAFGKTCCIEDPPLITSSRRFEGRRGWDIVLGWIEIHLLFFLGASPNFIARRYGAQKVRAKCSRVSVAKPARSWESQPGSR